MSSPVKQTPKNGAIVAVDVDNLLISFMKAGELGIPGYRNHSEKKDIGYLRGFSIKAGFENAFKWIETFGQILCVHLYLPYTQATNDSLWHGLWQEYKNKFLIETIFCPKKPVSTKNRKGAIQEKPDNVDAHLIEHSKRIVELYADRAGYFCLMAGDSDYRQFLRELIEKQIKVAFVLGSKKSFSSSYREGRITDIHPKTGEELVHYFFPRELEKI